MTQLVEYFTFLYWKMMYLVNNTCNQSCRRILFSKKKTKWPVYKKSTLIWTLKNKGIFQGETGLGAAVIGSIQIMDGFIGFGL